MKCAHFTCHACEEADLATARAEAAALRARIADYEADHRAVVAGLCASDERHCSCVPHLRREIERLRRALVHIADTCVQDPDTAQFAARVLDRSADVEEP